MAGSILAGWAVAAGRYRPRRWVRASRWAVTHTDSGGRGSRAGRGPGSPGRGARGRGSLIGGLLAGLDEHEQVAVDADVDGGQPRDLVWPGGVVGAGGELAAADGGVQGDDVLGVDEPDGAGLGDRLAGVIAQPAGARGAC